MEKLYVNVKNSALVYAMFTGRKKNSVQMPDLFVKFTEAVRRMDVMKTEQWDSRCKLQHKLFTKDRFQYIIGGVLSWLKGGEGERG